MPTTLPVRAALPAPNIDAIDFVMTMIQFYAAIAIPILIILLVDYHLGMFKGLTMIDAIMRATGPDTPCSHPELIGMF